MTLGYAKEKMAVAVRFLAASSDPLADRLNFAVAQAMIYGFDNAKQEGYLPEEVLVEMQRLIHRMEASGSVAGEGTLKATLAKMSEDELVECAEDIVSLAWEIQRLA